MNLVRILFFRVLSLRVIPVTFFLLHIYYCPFLSSLNQKKWFYIRTRTTFFAAASYAKMCWMHWILLKKRGNFCTEWSEKVSLFNIYLCLVKGRACQIRLHCISDAGSDPFLGLWIQIVISNGQIHNLEFNNLCKLFYMQLIHNKYCITSFDIKLTFIFTV